MPPRSAYGRRSLRCLWQALGLLVLGAVGFSVAFLLTGNRGVIPLAREYAPHRLPAAQVHPQAVHPQSNPTIPRTERTRPPVSSDTSRMASPGENTTKPAKETESVVRVYRPPVVTGEWEEVVHGSRSSPRIALTFDAGADSAPTLDILAVLAKHNVHCTFFLTGKWIERNPSLVRRIVAEGHEIGNHTYSHRRLTDLSDREIADELNRVEEQVLALTGTSTKPLARVPYGARDKRTLRIMASYGYRSIYWDVDSWDSVKLGITPDEIRERVLKSVRNGSIVLMHCGSRATANALDGILQGLETAGYQPVTIRQLLTYI